MTKEGNDPLPKPFALGQIMWVPDNRFMPSKVVGMIEFSGRLFVATESGVFVKGEDDVFRPVPIELERGPAQSEVELDDTIYYWLCCGSRNATHGDKSCHEAEMGHPERVRWGTVKQHSQWQKQYYKPGPARFKP